MKIKEICSKCQKEGSQKTHHCLFVSKVKDMICGRCGSSEDHYCEPIRFIIIEE